LLNTYFIEKDLIDEWKAKGYTMNIGQVIGKFRDTPYDKKKHSWMCTDNFEVHYVNGIATFSEK
jgi:hypothetical protein